METSIMSLGGMWKIVKDADRVGKAQGWEKSIPNEPVYDIPVPSHMPQNKWCWDYPYSNVFSLYHGYVWYYRTFDGVKAPEAGNRYKIEFDRVGYLCEVWVNGVFCGEHRHHEQKFTIDVTDVLLYGKENLIAVRCFEPVNGGERIDGIVLQEIPNGSWGLFEGARPECLGGIMNEVRLICVPEIRIDDVYIRTFIDSGKIYGEITVINESGADKNICVKTDICEHKLGNFVTEIKLDVSAAVGKNIYTFETVISDFKKWELNAPALYTASVSTDTGSFMTKRFGFKELRVKNGFFFLNGKRIFLKSAHAVPTAETAVSMKAMGFNAIRLIHRLFDVEVLDICDEIGLLVIESPLISWGMTVHEKTEEMVWSYNENMVLRDRGRACLGCFCFFNELPHWDVAKHGVSYLPRLRELDKGDLVLLSSGRWDKHTEIGSVSNPDSNEWECVWSKEGIATEVTAYHVEHPSYGCEELGDIHHYLPLPFSKITKKWYRNVGSEAMPVFISESGNGSQEDPERRWLEYTEKKANPARIGAYKAMWNRLEGYINDYLDMKGIFPFANDFAKESHRLNARQRQQTFDLIRSNPKIAGFSMTSWCSDNEGTIEGEYVLKEGMAHALQEGWAPLRWSLFTDEKTMYENKPFEIEAVLCNEDRLPAGTYKAEACIHGENGIVWEKKFDAVYPKDGYAGMPPLAATVLKEKISLPAGEYTFAVRLLEGGAPFGGRLALRIMKIESEKAEGKRVAVWGVSEKTLECLNSRDIEAIDFKEAGTPKLVLVGNPADCDDESNWDLLDKLANEGTSVLFLNAKLFNHDPSRLRNEEHLKAIAGKDSFCSFELNWLYHVDTVHTADALFENIDKAGIADFESFGPTYPELLFRNTVKPDKAFAAAIRPEPDAKGTVLAEYNKGAGKYILNSFMIEEAMGEHPFAEQFLMNFVSYYG